MRWNRQQYRIAGTESYVEVGRRRRTEIYLADICQNSNPLDDSRGQCQFSSYSGSSLDHE